MQTTEAEPLLESPSVLAVLPAWLVSLVIHLLLAITISLAVHGGAPSAPSAPAPPDERIGQIVLARREGTKTRYFADDESTARHQVLRPLEAGAALSGASPVGGEPIGGGGASDAPPLVPGIALPQLAGDRVVGDSLPLGAGLGASRGKVRVKGSPLDEEFILAEDALIPRETIPTGPTAPLSLFGSASAVGRSFVFVIDRSDSMGGSGLGAIQATADELSARMGQLSSEQTFQAVAYNQTATYFTGRELIAATDDNKRKLVQFLANLPAYGQTEHMRGLLSALKMKPEVIFLLTDGGDPVLDAGQLRTIREQAGGRTSIHCLHFGRGKEPSGKAFLSRLANENRGSYAYIDMNAP